MQKAARLRYLEQYGLTRTQTGYYYIAHYYPIRAMSEISAADAVAMIERLTGRSFEVYVHFPYCETACSFCHFHKEPAGRTFSLKEAAYLRLVEAEIEIYKGILGKIPARSFYIGGGTPSLMSNGQLQRFLTRMRSLIQADDDAEMKFEVFPKSYSALELEEKLTILRAFGFTDLVVDLESGNQRSLDTVGRRITSLDAYLGVVEAAVNRGFSSIVTALMSGLPFESFDSLQQTLERLVAIPEVTVINTFPLIIRRPDSIHRHYLRNRAAFPNVVERDALWIFARDYLRSKGFTEGPISYFHRPGKRPAQQADKFECVNLIGFGASAFGYWNGDEWASQYFNCCNNTDYAEAINAGRLPLWRAGILTQEERARRKLIFGLANCKTENLFLIEQRFGVSVDNVFGQTLNALLELGLIAVVPNEGIAYTEEGLCRLEEISYFLGSEFVKDSCARTVPPGRYRRELLSHHYYVRIPDSHRRKFQNFIANHSREFMKRLTVDSVRQRRGDSLNPPALRSYQHDEYRTQFSHPKLSR